MRKMLLSIALMSMTVAGCTPAIVNQAPAPLQQTVIDEKALITAFSAFDVLLTAVDGLVVAKVIVPGSPTAAKLKGYLATAQTALNAAAAAQKVGSTSSYLAALDKAREAFKLTSATLKGI